MSLSYVEHDATAKILGVMECKPDLILGNYTVENIVASLMASKLGPALYEAFGLTVIKVMNCGLPTFATIRRGPAEIIVDGVSGFHIDPKDGDQLGKKIVDFFDKCKVDSGYWDMISQDGFKCIYEWYGPLFGSSDN
ncbi:hypothetical protein LguiB_022093 [Lonicera macranthoides]